MKKKRKEKKLKQYNDEYNRHHIINKVSGGTDVEENIRKTKVYLHNCLHSLFANGTPAEIIKELIDYFDNVFTEGFRQDIYAVLSAHKGVEHNPRCYKGNRIKGRGTKPLLNKGTK